mmetsp:Transcript_110391/g.216445  ORF Transcript_110391/g.216445 Transcript_110391/m.216445 type:complete len:296 (-) Transcript_110391:322-1209(-)
MQVGVAILGHVVIDDDIDPLDVDAAAEQVRCDQNPFLELLELLVPGNPLLLRQARVDRDRREVALNEELVQRHGTLHGLHKDHYLVELQSVEAVVQLPVLLLFGQLHVVLQQTVQCQLGLLVHPDLVRSLHKLLAQRPRLGAHGRAEHHHLLLLRRADEDLLDVLPHVQLVQALVALVQHKVRELVQLQILLPEEPQHTSGRADEDVRATLLQHFPVLLDRHTAVDDSGLDLSEVLREAVELMLDLVCQFAGVADHQCLDRLLRGIELLQAGEDEHRGLAHARLRLAEDVRAQNR